MTSSDVEGDVRLVETTTTEANQPEVACPAADIGVSTASPTPTSGASPPPTLSADHGIGSDAATGSSGSVIERTSEATSLMDTDSVLDSRAMSVDRSESVISFSSSDQATLLIRRINSETEDGEVKSATRRSCYSVENNVFTRDPSPPPIIAETFETGETSPTWSRSVTRESNDEDRRYVDDHFRLLPVDPSVSVGGSRLVMSSINRETVRSFNDMLTTTGVTNAEYASSSTEVNRNRHSSAGDYLSPLELSVKNTYDVADGSDHELARKSRDASSAPSRDRNHGGYVVAQQPFVDLSMTSPRTADSGTGSSLTGATSAHRKPTLDAYGGERSIDDDDDVNSGQYHVDLQIPASSINYRDASVSRVRSSLSRANSAASLPVRRPAKRVSPYELAQTNGSNTFSGRSTPVVDTSGRPTPIHVVSVRVGDEVCNDEVDLERQTLVSSCYFFVIVSRLSSIVG